MLAQVSRRHALHLAMLGSWGAALTACSGSSDDPHDRSENLSHSTQVKLVVFATAKLLLNDLIHGFSGAHDDVSFVASYGASADQARKIVRGVPVDATLLALDSDVTRLAQAGKVSPHWVEAFPNHACPFGSLVVFVVRSGNPHGIAQWDDLLKDSVEVITPDPRSSGSAKWNLVAPYAREVHRGGLPAARTYIDELYRHHCRVRPSSSRVATTTFTSGQGDVLLSYENEAKLITRLKPGEYDIIVPKETVAIDFPVATIVGAGGQAHDFLTYMYSDQAQQIALRDGFRSYNHPATPDFVTPDRVWRIRELGGWPAVEEQLFSDKGLVTTILGQING